MRYAYWLARFKREQFRDIRISSKLARIDARTNGVDREGLVSPFYIVGPGRSGSTVLRRTLIDKYDVVIPPENPFYFHLAEAYCNVKCAPWEDRAKAALDGWYDRISQPIKRVTRAGEEYIVHKEIEFGIDVRAVFNDCVKLAKDERDLASIIETLYRNYAGIGWGIDFSWGDKAPWLVFHWRLLRTIFPDAKFIFLVRNPIDYSISYMGRFGVSLECAAARWAASYDAAMALRSQAKNNFVCLRYEDLVENAGREVKSLEKFCSLSERGSNAISKVIFRDDNLPHHENSKRNISASVSHTSASSVLSSPQIQWLRDKLGCRMFDLSYE